MYLTILQHGEKTKVITYDLERFNHEGFGTEDWLDFMSYTLNIDDCEWIVHEDLPETVTVIDTNGDYDE
jgi:hypothetical protein